MPVRSGYMPVKKALRPEVQLCIGEVVREDRAFVADAIDVRRFADHQAAMVDARLHPSDVVAHDENDIGFLGRLLCGCWRAGGPGKRHHRRRAEQDSAGTLKPTRRLAWRRCNKGRLSAIWYST